MAWSPRLITSAMTSLSAPARESISLINGSTDTAPAFTAISARAMAIWSKALVALSFSSSTLLINGTRSLAQSVQIGCSSISSIFAWYSTIAVANLSILLIASSWEAIFIADSNLEYDSEAKSTTPVSSLILLASLGCSSCSRFITLRYLNEPSSTPFKMSM